MTDKETHRDSQDSQPEDRILFYPSGRVILPEKVMEEIVVETLGCKLWYNEKTTSLGIKLLRGDDSPPVLIERQAGEGGKNTGVIEVMPFLNKVGFKPIPETVSLPFRYFEKYHLLEIQLGERVVSPGLKEKGFLNDYDGLED
ncbi:MAG: hypothetical protein JRG97_16830 [Deltaproteobacteria bacterium]|nr:hypothetical protein [Deltaproteobacteria bacterium]MBW2051514.1 hypothetical protein [Deltaproteobacteria bacterium]MBW2142691.1 hypothetical protein [Deltaproteobacteria bacterium]